MTEEILNQANEIKAEMDRLKREIELLLPFCEERMRGLSIIHIQRKPENHWLAIRKNAFGASESEEFFRMTLEDINLLIDIKRRKYEELKFKLEELRV